MRKILYFAYGSNMNLDQMAFRCPDAEVVGIVRLEGYRIAFRSNGGGVGVATILPDQGSHVDGVLWLISKEDEQNLNFYEGYPRLYDKETVTVSGKDGKQWEAIVYMMNQPYRDTPANPSQSYLTGILCGCIQNGIAYPPGTGICPADKGRRTKTTKSESAYARALTTHAQQESGVFMKTKIMHLMLLLALFVFFTGCADGISDDSTAETSESENGTVIEQTSPTEPTVGADPTKPREESESKTEDALSLNAASSGQTGGKPGNSSSAGSSIKPSGGGTTGGGTGHSAPSSQTPSSTSSSKPNGGGSSSIPTVPGYLKPYVYPFDIPAIKADLISYGENLDMTHYTHHPDGELRTPDNCSWWNPYPLIADCKDPERTRRQLQERVKFDMDDLGLVDFTIYIEAGPNNQYAVFMMH